MIQLIATPLMLLCLWAPCFSAEILSEKALEETTARGLEAQSFETLPARSTTTVQIQNQSQITQILESQSQTHLRGGAVTNAAGRNQIANGINVR